MPLIDDCPIQLPPLFHQLERWRKTRNKKFWGRHWDPGVGKSCISLMEAAWMYHHRKIDGCLVLAPDGVHRNWVTDEIPTHWPKEFGAPASCWYRSGSAERQWHIEEIEKCLSHKGMSFLAMSYDALDTDDKHPNSVRKALVKGGRTWAKEFLTRRKVLIIGDESSRIKSNTARRTVLSCKAAALAVAVRTCNGTPVTNGPFDIYSQVCFLDPKIGPRGGLQSPFWISKGINSFEGFKAQFGEWGMSFQWTVDSKGQRVKRHFPELKGYRNLEILQQWLTEISDRLTKEDAKLHLPEKLYKTLRYDLSPAQRRVYDTLKREALVFLDSGELVTTPMVLTKMIRLQQITSGYVAVDDVDEDPIRDIGKENPRLDLLREVCEDLHHKVIIWTRFRRDVDLIMEMLTKMGRKAVRYDGSVGDEDRKANVLAFQKGDAQFFVSNPSAGGEGLTLLGDQSVADGSLACQTCIYYNNDHSLQKRLQSEDRCHRIGQKWPVQYIDIVADKTIDDAIIECLRNKLNIAAQVTGDKFRQWISTGAA